MSNAMLKQRPKVALQNIGCKLNLYEIEALKANFDGNDYQVVPFNTAADIYVVNTCTVTGSGDADSRKALRRARRLNPDAAVVATGCYAQRRPDELRQAGADLVVSNDEKARLLERVEAHLTGQPVANPAPPQQLRTTEFLAIDDIVIQGRTRGTLQIQDGCDEHCTYCIIPTVRGSSSSRPAKQIISQAQRMVAAGYRELALTGVHSGSYGYDQDAPASLVNLLHELETIDGLERIRLNSIEPKYVSDELIDYAARSNKFCRHFHIPLQSGDDQILKRMGRQYTRAFYSERLERIAMHIPDCALGADVMVGFPGETAAQFSNTYELLASLPISYLHVFPYSLRPETPAERLKDHLPKHIKKDRTKQLIGLSQQKRLAFHQKVVGRSVKILLEDLHDKHTGLSVGLSDNYIKVLFDGKACQINDILTLNITHAREDLVFGEI